MPECSRVQSSVGFIWESNYTFFYTLCNELFKQYAECKICDLIAIAKLQYPDEILLTSTVRAAASATTKSKRDHYHSQSLCRSVCLRLSLSLSPSLCLSLGLSLPLSLSLSFSLSLPPLPLHPVKNVGFAVPLLCFIIAQFVRCEVLDSNYFVLFLSRLSFCQNCLNSCLVYWVLLCLSSGTDL